MAKIPNFNVELAKEYVKSFKSIFLDIFYLRYIDKISTNSKQYQDLLTEVLNQPEMRIILNSQLESGGFLPLDEDLKIPAYRSTPYILIYLGFLGLDCFKEKMIEKAVNYCLNNFINTQNHLEAQRKSYADLQCENALFLKSLLVLGFEQKKKLQDACMSHLMRNEQFIGSCKYKKGGTPCAFTLIRNLDLYNYFPDKLKDERFDRIKKQTQEYLLKYDLHKADYPRVGEKPNSNWFKFSYFRSSQGSVFHGLETLVESGVETHPTIEKTLKYIGSLCIKNKTWRCSYYQKKWPLKLEGIGLSPWLSIRGLRIENANTD